MPDNKKKTSIDRLYISLEQPYEKLYWTRRLRCSLDFLRCCIELVGNRAQSVRLLKRQVLELRRADRKASREVKERVARIIRLVSSEQRRQKSAKDRPKS